MKELLSALITATLVVGPSACTKKVYVSEPPPTRGSVAQQVSASPAPSPSVVTFPGTDIPTPPLGFNLKESTESAGGFDFTESPAFSADPLSIMSAYDTILTADGYTLRSGSGVLGHELWSKGNAYLAEFLTLRAPVLDFEVFACPPRPRQAWCSGSSGRPILLIEHMAATDSHRKNPNGFRI